MLTISNNKNIRKLVCLSIIYIIILIIFKILLQGFHTYNFNKNITGINIKFFSTIKTYIQDFQRYNTNILIKLFISLFIFVPLVPFVFYWDFNKEINIIEIFLLFFVISLIYSFFSRIIEIGVFDIDFIFLRAFLPAIIYSLINLKKRKLK